MTATRVEHDDLGPVNVAGDRRSTRSIRGAELVVGRLKAQGVRHVFGVPGAKIDRGFDALIAPAARAFRTARERGSAPRCKVWATRGSPCPKRPRSCKQTSARTPSRDLDVAERRGRRTGRAGHPDELIPTPPDEKG